MGKRIAKLIVMVFLVACCVTVQASFPLYAIDGNFPADSGQTSQLYRIDPETGAVVEVVGDTGLNLTAMVWWPPTGTFLATTALQSELSSFLVEINPFTAESSPLVPIVDEAGLFPGGPFQFSSLEIQPDEPRDRLLVLSTSDLGTDLRILSIEEGLLFRNPFSGFAPQGSFAMAASGLDDTRPLWVFFGCEPLPSVTSYYRGPIISSSPPIIPIFVDLPDSSCFVDGLRSNEGNYLGVQFDPSSEVERQLTRLIIENEEASLELLGDLPDRTVSIARGPAPPANVPILSRSSLTILCLLMALMAFAFMRSRFSRYVDIQ